MRFTNQFVNYAFKRSWKRGCAFNWILLHRVPIRYKMFTNWLDNSNMNFRTEKFVVRKYCYSFVTPASPGIRHCYSVLPLFLCECYTLTFMYFWNFSISIFKSILSTCLYNMCGEIFNLFCYWREISFHFRWRPTTNRSYNIAKMRVTQVLSR
jgi:hypothetical protein